jgi:hypothetical protein
MAVPLERYINVSITAGTRTVEQAGFGIPLIMAFFPTTVFATRTTLYSGTTGLADMVTDGFVASDAAYYMAQAVLSQNPRVENFVVGRLEAAGVADFDYELTVSNTTDSISVTILGQDHTGGFAARTPVEQTFTITGTGVAANDATTLAAAIAAGTLGTATMLAAAAVGATISITPGVGAPGDGYILYFSDITRDNLKFYDNSLAPAGLPAEILAITNENDTGYVWLHQTSSETANAVIAADVETEEKIALLQSQDHAIPDGTAGNIALDLQTAAYTRSCLWYSEHGLDQSPHAAFAGRMLPYLPGQASGAWKSLTGVTADDVLVTADATEIETSNCNWYPEIAGVGVTYQGIMPDGGWFDEIRLTDWLREEIRTRLANVLINNDKIPYTDAAGEIAVSEIESAYELGATRGGFVLADFSATYLPAASQTVADRAARIFNGVEFAGTFAGAAHQFRVSGRIS